MEQHSAADLEKPYDPREVESRWYDYWLKAGVFNASSDPADKRPVYVCPMPPPNVTGSLHMGHAMRCTFEDVLVRYHRMCGFNTLWQPGIDHAGIATQTVVERQLQREGKTRFDLGREEFEKRIWAWKAESGGRIAMQQRVLGSSPDWARSKFTMDADMSVAVKEAFVRLYEEGLMYRATRLINWDPVLRTSLSDLEVDHEETNGELFQFAYKVEGSDEELVVATTRPETMLGDTAVAVHPDDPRYKHLHGKKLVHPFVDRKIPVITDAILVDMKFGTGAVKVTPAHDFNDFATGKRHKLEEINIFNLDGTVNEVGGQFKDLPRERARTAVKKALDEKGLARGSKPHRLTVPKSQRSGVAVEPMISTQWFLKMSHMAEQALAVVREGKTQILPEEWTKTYEHFLENIQDWCVSRQLWWGHQIPAWHGPNGEIRVGRTRPEECDDTWTQDPDVLDTWFSSALWPFATQGWPVETDSLKKFYPASDLETGYDILFFWVARMIMFGLHFTGQTPFKRVLLSGLIVDETGDKMSKVKGNVIDPLDLIHGATFSEMVQRTNPGAPEGEALAKFKKAYPSVATMGTGFPAFGADALRFTLASFPPSNKRIALAPKRLEGYRHFLNKIWNASRLVLDLAKKNAPPATAPKANAFVNQWILSRLGAATEAAHAGIGAFRIDEAATDLYKFFWTDFCDWYLELIKPILRDSADATLRTETADVALHVLASSLRLLHPIIPYVTEELWQRLDHGTAAGSIALSAYPKDLPRNATVEADMDLLQRVITAARAMRAEHDIKPQVPVAIFLRTDNARARSVLEKNLADIGKLAKSDGMPQVDALTSARETGVTVSVVPADGGSIEVGVSLRGHVTAEKELERIDREIKKLQKDVEAINKKLSSKGFADRAPKEVIDEANAQLAAFTEALAALERAKKFAEELR
jgi:valyl-tRNA synthetase